MQHEGLGPTISSFDGVNADCTAAFFDLDNTILNMHTMILFARYLSDQAWISEHQVSAMLAAVKDAERVGAAREQTNGIFFSILNGLSEEEYLLLGSQWWEQAEKKFVVPVLLELELLKAYGVPVIAVSGSYSCCVLPITRSLEMAAGFGSEPEISGGILTGKVRDPLVGEHKKAKLLEYLGDHAGLSASTLAYGDHRSDFPMLSAASKACFVHSSPTDTATLSYVRSRGWRVVTV